jgi:hypothetical protein
MPDVRIAFLVALLFRCFAAFAEDGLPIVFLPPPMEGTISLGIFDASGKLVRVLHREAELKDFTAGENGLVTRWDGRDDAGQPLPPGKYGARGWMAGDLVVEGVAFHGNDWIKDDSPRFTRVVSVKNNGRDEVRVTLRTADGKEETLAWKLSREGAAPPAHRVEANVEDGKLVIRNGGAALTVTMGDAEKAVSCVVGFGDRVWVIVETPLGREVRAYSADGEFLRRLPYAAAEPQPRQLAASEWSEMIFLLEENSTEQRLRALSLGAPNQEPAKSPESTDAEAGKSAWHVAYLKSIRDAAGFDAIAPHLGRPNPLKAEPVVKIQTVANPLLGDAKGDVSLKVKIDAEGASLTTESDLPLTRLTATPNLKWAVLAKEGATLSLFQSDGVVVEEFKIEKPENMMSFDAGEVQLKPAGAKNEKPKDGSGAAPKRKRAMRPGDDL